MWRVTGPGTYKSCVRVVKETVYTTLLYVTTEVFQLPSLQCYRACEIDLNPMDSRKVKAVRAFTANASLIRVDDIYNRKDVKYIEYIR